MEKSDHWRRQVADLHPEAEQDPEGFLDQWQHTGGFRDYGTPSAVCGLCGNQGLRYHYLIADRKTGEAMWVGSQCILNFQIDPAEVMRRQRKARRAEEQEKQETEQQVQLVSMLSGLQHIYLLANQQEQRKLRWLVGRYLHRGGFSPAEAGWIYQAMLASGVKLDPALFPLRIRTKREKVELKQLTISALCWLAPQFTTEQQELIKKIGLPID